MSTPARPASSGSYDVVVVGGGPVGMWLAAELHRGGVRPVVLERHAKRPVHSKALTIYPRTIEQFAMRGIADRWLAEGTPVPSTHFAILRNRLDMSFLDTRYPYTLFLPQRRTEELLEEHLAELGVPYLTERTVTGLRQDETGVELDVDSPRGPVSFRAAYVAGCDGARSVIRAAAGIDFAGTPDTWRTIMGDVELTSPPQAPALTLNQPGGSLYMVALGDGRYRLATIDHATMYSLSDGPVPFEDLRASALRIAETDFGMRETADAWLSRVGNATRQAARYRAGRVLLAGDAAHIHYPAGGQGLNLGLQDAGNLAWKLAAEIRGWAPPGLLDTYHAERYPVGLDVIDSSLAQCGLFANASREGIALRDQFNAILGSDPALCRELATRLSGLAIRYPAADQIAGQRVPDLDLRGGPAATIFGLLHPAKFLLLTQGTAVDAPTGYGNRLDIVTAEFTADRPEWASVRSMLIRPDGYIAWATNTDDPPPFAEWLGNALCSRLKAHPCVNWRGRHCPLSRAATTCLLRNSTTRLFAPPMESLTCSPASTALRAGGIFGNDLTAAGFTVTTVPLTTLGQREDGSPRYRFVLARRALPLGQRLRHDSGRGLASAVLVGGVAAGHGELAIARTAHAQLHTGQCGVGDGTGSPARVAVCHNHGGVLLEGHPQPEAGPRRVHVGDEAVRAGINPGPPA